MIEKKFYIPGLVLGILTFLVGFVTLPVEALVVSIPSLILNIRKRDTHRIKLGIFFTILGMLMGILELVYIIRMLHDPIVSTDYWLYVLLSK